ncbi:MAG: hypothetical protein Q8Q07_03070 [Dehalococcoidales bacterium]|nr:hypothetical protein [Dehalococcoidales bacterium]
MEIEPLRDIVIIVSGLVVTLVALFVAVISFSLYRKANSILKSTMAAAKKIEEVGKPLLQAAGFLQGITCGILAMGKIFKKRSK